MKTLLIHPYITSSNQFTNLIEPLGLIYLASYIKSHEIEILDLYGLGVDRIEKIGSLYRKGISDSKEILDMIKKYNPEVVGITCNFTEYSQDAFEIAKLVKDNFKNIILIMGGAHVTMDAENTLKNNQSVDIIVRSEGEITFKELLDAFQQKKDISPIEGISYRDVNGKIVSNPDRELIADINQLPIPDRQKLTTMDVYLKTNTRALAFVKNEPVASIMTSRGCPFNCIFCSTKMVWRRRWRPRSPEKVVEEIEMLVRNYKVKEIAIYDDQFIVDKQRVIDICNLLIEKKLKISLSIPSGTSVWLADEVLLKKMKEAGFYRICFPIETGNENTMKFIRKPVNLLAAKKMIALTNKIGIWTQGNFIIGFPYETKEEIEMTIKYAFESGLDYALFYIAKPFAGSEMYEIFKQEKLLTRLGRGINVETTEYDTTTMKAEELQSIRDKAASNYLLAKFVFYLNPVNFYNCLLPKLTTLEDVSYAIKIFFKIIKKAMVDKLIHSERIDFFKNPWR